MTQVNIQSPVIQQTTYGKYIPQYFYPVDNSTWRADKYISGSTGEESVEGVLTLGMNDLSPVVVGSPTLEDRSKCHCCFAGYAHTENAHNNSINR